MEILISKLSESAKAKIIKLMPTAKTISFEHTSIFEEVSYFQINRDEEPCAMSGGEKNIILDVFLEDDDNCSQLWDYEIENELLTFIN